MHYTIQKKEENDVKINTFMTRERILKQNCICICGDISELMFKRKNKTNSFVVVVKRKECDWWEKKEK